MSQQHGTGSGPSSSRLHDAPSRYATTPARQNPTRPALATSTSSPSAGSLFEPSDTRGPALPPIQAPSEPAPPHPDASRTPRSLGVHSILNPSQESRQPRGYRRSASQMECPSPNERDAAPAPDYFSQHGIHGGMEARRAPSMASSAVGHPRRVLSPRSPLYRTQSLGMIRPPTGTINAQETPFLSPGAQEYRTDAPASLHPSLPTPPAVQRTGFNFPPPSAMSTPSIPQSQSRRTSVGISQPPQPPSASASPHGTHSHGGKRSPFGEPRRSSQAPFISAPPSSQAPSPSTLDSERSYGIPVGSTGQSNYQLLTLETNQGHVQIPVDVQAASKVADEKRKRNAGASARFRARRKEKEKEASTTISRLEQQVREANEDVEFYRRERDYLAQLVYQAPGGDRHFPRPSSPRLRRMSMQTQGSTGGGSSGQGSTSAGSTPSIAYSSYPPTEQRGDQRAEPERNVRRRTSSYLPTPHAAPGPQAQPPMGYPPTSYAPLGTAQPSPQSHPSTRSMPPVSLVPQNFQPAAPQPHYPPSQAPERAERSWPPQSQPRARGPPPPPGPL